MYSHRSLGYAIAASVAYLCLSHPVLAQTLRVEELRDGKRYTPGQANPPAPSSRRVIRLRWPQDATVNGVEIKWYRLERTSPNSGLLIYFAEGSPNHGTTSYDDADWDYGTTYQYTLYGGSRSYGLNPNTNMYEWIGSPIEVTVPVTVRRVVATAAQPVDTRIDPRYSTYVLKNHNFFDSLYRGGLFAGYNADGSKVARSYFKFSGLVGPPVAGQQLWAAGGLSLYFTRSAQSTQSTPAAFLKARLVTDDTWDAATLVWGNAPSFKNTGADGISLPWVTGEPGRWVSFNVLPDLEQTLTQNGGDGTLSIALSAEGESNGGTNATFPLQAAPGWAYFGRSGYTQDGLTDIAPYLLYAYGGVGADISLVAVAVPDPPTTIPPTPRKLYSNTTTTGTVILAAPAPAGGVIVKLSSSSPQVTVPASVLVPAGAKELNFVVTSGTISAIADVTITATLGKTVTTTVPVAP